MNIAKMPLEREVAVTQATLDDARAMGQHELADLIECDMFQAVALLWNQASPMLRRDILALVRTVAP